MNLATVIARIGLIAIIFVCGCHMPNHPPETKAFATETVIGHMGPEYQFQFQEGGWWKHYPIQCPQHWSCTVSADGNSVSLMPSYQEQLACPYYSTCTIHRDGTVTAFSYVSKDGK